MGHHHRPAGTPHQPHTPPPTIRPHRRDTRIRIGPITAPAWTYAASAAVATFATIVGTYAAVTLCR